MAVDNIKEDMIDSLNSSKRGAKPASLNELTMAVQSLQEQNNLLKKELEASKSEASAISKLADALTSVVSNKETEKRTISDIDNVNRISDFKNTRATVDGRNMFETQQILMSFRNEEKKPISISRSMADRVGGNLDITVNGVRVSIPCDGKTYFINATHYEHAKERLAKIDILNSDVGETIEV